MSIVLKEKHGWLFDSPPDGMARDVMDNHEEFLKRLVFFRGHGCDFIEEREFIYRNSLPLNGALLEVGTGKGHFAMTLARHGHRFLTVDVNATDQRIAWMNLAYYGWEGMADIRLADAERLPLPDKSIETVLSVNVVHHLARPERVGEEMIRVLTETGKIVLADFTEEGMALVDHCHALEGNTHDAFYHQMDGFRAFFDKKGFRHETVRTLHQEVLVTSRKRTS